MSAYIEKLKDVRWQKKRLEILSRDNFTCQGCWDNEESAKSAGATLTLHVHHMYYISGREPWNYPNNILVTLCAECHKEQDESAAYESDLISILKSKKCLMSDFRSLCHAVNAIEYPERQPLWLMINAAMETMKKDWVRELVNEITIQENYDEAIEILKALKKRKIEGQKIEKSLSRLAGTPQQDGGFF